MRPQQGSRVWLLEGYAFRDRVVDNGPFGLVSVTSVPSFTILEGHLVSLILPKWFVPRGSFVVQFRVGASRGHLHLRRYSRRRFPSGGLTSGMKDDMLLGPDETREFVRKEVGVRTYRYYQRHSLLPSSDESSRLYRRLMHVR